MMLSEPPLPPLTVTVALCVAGVVPLAPLQVRVKVVVTLSGPVLALPLVGSLPDHPPEALQLVALVEDQLRFEALPLLTLLGLALRDRVGAAAIAGDNDCPPDEFPKATWLSVDVPPPQAISAAISAQHQARRVMSRGRRIWGSAIRIELRYVRWHRGLSQTRQSKNGMTPNP